jgi:hypothetical protein
VGGLTDAERRAADDHGQRSILTLTFTLTGVKFNRF